MELMIQDNQIILDHIRHERYEDMLNRLGYMPVRGIFWVSRTAAQESAVEITRRTNHAILIGLMLQFHRYDWDFTPGCLVYGPGFMTLDESKSHCVVIGALTIGKIRFIPHSRGMQAFWDREQHVDPNDFLTHEVDMNPGDVLFLQPNTPFRCETVMMISVFALHQIKF